MIYTLKCSALTYLEFCFHLLCRDGIDFVFQGFVQQAEKHAPPNITYLTILSEFSSKLLKPDKKTV